MAAITLTPLDPTTAPVHINTEIIYHVYDLPVGTRVIYGKGGNIPYQVDVVESASTIAGLCNSLVLINTETGINYIFVGTGGTGDGKGIMIIESDGGTGSKILFKYTEENTPFLLMSTDSPSTIAAAINALA